MPIKDPVRRKIMQKAYNVKWYKKNRDQIRTRIKTNKLKVKIWFKEYKKTLNCDRCPETDPVCLDFHHIDPSKKEIAISNAANSGWSIKRILKEISKCDILCANCHRKEHAK
jgi:hypothetical protein